MKAIQFFTATTLLGAFLISGCAPEEGFDGDATIKGQVKHHDDEIETGHVYIKFGAADFPGNDVAVYDDLTEITTGGNYAFEGLKKGDYYLYAEGWDSTFNETVVGGVPVKIQKKAETVVSDVAVTE